MEIKLTIEEVAKRFGDAHRAALAAETRKKNWRQQFFDLIHFKDEELARQVIFYPGDDPEIFVTANYPKWRILKKTRLQSKEWKVIIEEDPQYKKFTLINPLDGQVYERTVSESAPNVDLDRLKEEKPAVYMSITYKPDPPRELKPLDKLTEDQKEILKDYLLPPKLTPTMQRPRKPKEDEHLHSK